MVVTCHHSVQSSQGTGVTIVYGQARVPVTTMFQLRALSGYSGCIAALQLNSGRASLTLVTVAQIYLR